jgi:hypothetical protein
MDRKLGEPLCQCGRGGEEKNSCLCRASDPQAFEPEASCFTDCDIRQRLTSELWNVLLIFVE